MSDEKIYNSLEGYLCGYADATGYVPPKKLIMKYLMDTFRFKEDKALEICENHCEGWWSDLSSGEEDD